MSYEYEITVETPVYVDPNLVAQKVRETIKRILEKYGVFAIEAEARISGKREEEALKEEV